MSLQITLASIRSAAGTYEKQASAYLLRSGRVLPATGRVFRSEELFLRWAATEHPAGATKLWIADPGGETLSTDLFAERVRSLRDAGIRHFILAVGPADGWSAHARSAASLRLSLGPMTLPHELATLVLAEQVYRVSTILQGHPYHLGH